MHYLETISRCDNAAAFAFALCSRSWDVRCPILVLGEEEACRGSTVIYVHFRGRLLEIDVVSGVESQRGFPKSYPRDVTRPLDLVQVTNGGLSRTLPFSPFAITFSLDLVQYQWAGREQKHLQRTRPRSPPESVQIKVIPFIPRFRLIPALGKTAKTWRQLWAYFSRG
jgi:hypothetical protein